MTSAVASALKTYAEKRTQLDYTRFLLSLNFPALQSSSPLEEQVFQHPHVFQDPYLVHFFTLYEVLHGCAFFQEDRGEVGCSPVDRYTLDYELNYGYDHIENRIYFYVPCSSYSSSLSPSEQDFFEISYVFSHPEVQNHAALFGQLLQTYMDVSSRGDTGDQEPTLEKALDWIKSVSPLHPSANQAMLDADMLLDATVQPALCVFYDDLKPKSRLELESGNESAESQWVEALRGKPLSYESHISVLRFPFEAFACAPNSIERAVLTSDELVLFSPVLDADRAGFFEPHNLKAVERDPKLQGMLDLWESFFK